VIIRCNDGKVIILTSAEWESVVKGLK
jgi:hypothetical protein